MKKNNTKFYLTISLLAASSLVFLCLFLSFWNTSNNYKKQLENNYKKNFYEVISNINDIEVDVSKVVATSDSSTQRELLAGIYNTSQIGVNNLNLLPVSYNKMTKLNSVLNKIGGYSYSLLADIYEGGALNEDDYAQILNIHKSIKEIQYDLNAYVSKLQYDYDIMDEIDFSDSELSDFSAGLINTESSNSKVPSLIYDGPFSDSVLNKEIVGLGDVAYSSQDAVNLLQKHFSDYTIDYVGDTNGKFSTYNYNLNSDKHSLYVSVSKIGGMILGITSFGGVGEGDNNFDGITIAQDFAKKLGLENMYSVWNQKVGNVMYVNLAPIISKVIHYSDLVKVKVDLTTGDVIGWEATAYATNHKNRNFTSSITLSEAEKKVSAALKIIERNYTIVPDKFVGEVSAYEFICEWQDYTYYIYIDSNTGKEINIMRVVATTNGDLLL